MFKLIFVQILCQQCIEKNTSSRTQCMTYKQRWMDNHNAQCKGPWKLTITSKICRREKCPQKDINTKNERNETE